jgi:hypothetical protein
MEDPLIFPVIGAKDKKDNYGLKLRDYLASKAMISLIGKYQMWTGKDGEQFNFKNAEIIAKFSYSMADEMLKFRKK